MKKASILLLLLYLGVWGKHLALWNDKSTRPIIVFPYQTALYPEADQQALKQGIPISSLTEASRLLEDYFS